MSVGYMLAALFVFTLFDCMAEKDGDERRREWELKGMNEKRANVVAWGRKKVGGGVSEA